MTIPLSGNNCPTVFIFVHGYLDNELWRLSVLAVNSGLSFHREEAQETFTISFLTPGWQYLCVMPGAAAAILRPRGKSKSTLVMVYQKGRECESLSLRFLIFQPWKHLEDPMSLHDGTWTRPPLHDYQWDNGQKNYRSDICIIISP